MTKSRAPLTPILVPAFWGVVIFVIALAIAIGQLARSNRPHELTAAPLVTLIQIAAVWLLGLAIVRLARALMARREVPVSQWHWLSLLVLLPLTVASILFLTGSASTAVEVWRFK